MARSEYEPAGIAAIACSIGTVAALVLTLALDITSPGRIIHVWQPSQVLLKMAIDIVTVPLGIYAALRLRRLLNERYRFHGLDGVIWAAICAELACTVSRNVYRMLAMLRSPVAPVAIAVSVALALAWAAIGIVFALRLLRLEGDLLGYKKPLAYICLAKSVAYVLVLTAIFGVVLEPVYYFVLGLAFFATREQPQELDIV